MVNPGSYSSFARRPLDGWRGRLDPLWRYYTSAGSVVLWLMLWLSINTGPWLLREVPRDFLGWVHAVRAAFPLVVLILCGIVASGQRTVPGRRLVQPLAWWLAYGIISFAAGFMWPAADVRPSVLDPTYWALAYLAVIATAWIHIRDGDPLENSVRLNHVTWMITMLLLVGLLFAARQYLFAGAGFASTRYDVVDRIGTIAEMPMSRSTGLARFAAIPAVVCFVLVWRRQGLEKLLWAGIVVVCTGMVYMMQSRGAIVGLGVAIGFALLFLGPRARVAGTVVLVIFVLALALDMVPQQVIAHLTNKYASAHMGVLTGRTRAWQNAWEQIVKSPLWGWGMQADRALIHEHVHNTYFYALLSSGFTGAFAFAMGLLIAWRQFIDVAVSGVADRLGQRTTLVQVGAVLAFFTARGMAEVSGAMFAIDYMIMLPAVAYIGILAQRVGGPVRWHGNER